MVENSISLQSEADGWGVGFKRCVPGNSINLRSLNNNTRRLVHENVDTDIVYIP